MDKRALGITGESLSVVGFGGVVVADEDVATADRLVARAIERGINYFDVAPSYGNAEEQLGPALQRCRGSVFLACKTLMRDKDAATAELENSLRTLRTDWIDLYQFHAVNTLEEVDQIVGAGGALEAVLEAQRQGRVRFIGFSSHSERAALALLACFRFDSVLFPFNRSCWQVGRFGPRLLHRAQAAGVGVLGLKALARRKLAEGEARHRPKCWYAPVADPDEAHAAVRFALSLPITALVSPGDAELLWWACDAADAFEPLAQFEMSAAPKPQHDHDPLFAVDV